MLQVKNLHYSIGEKNLLSGITWMIQPGKRVALVGPNGSGKTTLLRILNGEIESYKGRIVKSKHYRIGHLPQEEIALGNGTVLETTLFGRPDILDLEKKIRGHHLKLENWGDDQTVLLNRLGQFEQKYQALGGYEIEVKAKTILSGLGFSEKEFDRPFSKLSGGWGMRAHLARLLLNEPDLLLLDEPTNHLDIPSMEWLESYLLQFKGSVIIVSHDRFFIDRLVGEIYELDRGALTKYVGNYHTYEDLKERNEELLRKKWEEQKAERERIERFINRYRSDKKRAAQVQSRIRMMGKMETIDLPPTRGTFKFTLSSGIRSYKDVLDIRGLHFRYEEDWVLKEMDLYVSRGEKLALVGENGAGKTTLTRLISGELSSLKGTVHIGQRAEIAYYAQHQIKSLNLNADVYDEVSESTSQNMMPFVRDILGLFQFSGKDVHKKIGILSGGEKARVSLAKILVSPANVLIMDEPTTHLDQTARDALEQALIKYEGTLILISHDRYFLDKIVHRVVELKEGRVFEYLGNYSDYLEKRDIKPNVFSSSNGRDGIMTSGRMKKAQKRKEAEARQSVSQERNRLEKEIVMIEDALETLEAKKNEVESLLSHPETYESSRNDIAHLQKEYARIRKLIEERVTKWEKSRLALDKLLESIKER